MQMANWELISDVFFALSKILCAVGSLYPSPPPLVAVASAEDDEVMEDMMVGVILDIKLLVALDIMVGVGIEDMIESDIVEGIMLEVARLVGPAVTDIV